MDSENSDVTAATIADIVANRHPLVSLNAATNDAILRITRYLDDDFCIGHSGGKDSAVVHFLANKILNLNLPVAHTSKTEGFNAIHPSTLVYLYSRPFPIELYPEGTDFPYKGQIDGTRSNEAERLNKSTDLIVDGVSINRKHMTEYNPVGLFGLKFIYPIFDWTDEMVWAFHYLHRIPYSDEYHNEKKILLKTEKLLSL